MEINELKGRELDAAVGEALGLESGDSFAYSYKVRAFSYVKDKIEQRDWGWASRYVPSVGKCRFEVIVLPATRGVNNRFKVWAETEELAGCRAFLKACEEQGDVKEPR